MVKKIISLIVSLFVLNSGLTNLLIVYSADTDLMNESFDSYSDDFYESWTTDMPDNVLISETGYKSSAMVLNSSITDTISVHKSFGKSIISECFTIEAYIKGNGNTKFSFLMEDGSEIYVASWNEDNVIKYSKTGANRMSSIGDECKLADIGTRWNKLKIIVNKTNNTYKFVTGNGVSEQTFTAEIGNISGIRFALASGMDKTVSVDEIRIYDGEETVSSVFADYSGAAGSSFGAVFLTEDEITESGIALQCATENESGNYTVKKDSGRIKVDVDADAALGCDGYKNLFVDVTYKDSGYGWFYLKYLNTAGKIVMTESICLYDTGEETTETFKFDNVCLNESDDGVDFEIVTHTVDENHYDRAVGYRDFSLYPVYISSINIYHNGTYSPINVTVNTDNTGNIFFGREIPRFDIELENRAEEEIIVTSEITVSQYDRYMKPTVLQTKREQHIVSAGEKKTVGFSCLVNEYGLYVFDIRIFDEQKKINDTITVPFSKCVENDVRNETMGVNIHSVLENNADPWIVMELADKSGIGTIRDSFFWYAYEKEEGIYALTPEQEALLDAAIDYDMELLAIPLGQNGVYKEYMTDRLMTEEGAKKYGEFVYHLLKEPKFLTAVDRVEIWNEPDIHTAKTTPDAEVDATNVTNEENYQYRAKLYSNILMDGYKGVKRAEAEVNKAYIAGGLSIQNIWFYGAGMKFADCVFDYCQKSEDASEFNGGQYFDTIALHPYWGDDPEKGDAGVWYTNILGGLAETTEGYRGLATGGLAFKTEGIDEWQTAVGEHTGNTYDFEFSEGMWHTEYGLSTAIHPNSVATGVKNTGTDTAPVYEIQEDREWLQAENLIRGFDCVKAMNFDDKLWYYDFIDDGLRDNEHEYNFGILHNWNDEVPYAAKFSYLTMSAYNKLTEGATKARMYDDYDKYGKDTAAARKGSKLAFITKYEAPTRNIYMLRTTKSTAQYINPHDICEDFPTDISKLKFYDMLGNKISPDNFVVDGKYMLTQTPYYVVEGEDISFGGTPKAYVALDGAYYNSIGTSEIDVLNLKAVIDFCGNEPESYKVLVALYKGDMLCGIKTTDKENGVKNGDFKEFSDFGFSGNTDFDKLKIIVISDFDGIKPMAEAFESD